MQASHAPHPSSRIVAGDSASVAAAGATAPFKLSSSAASPTRDIAARISRENSFSSSSASKHSPQLPAAISSKSLLKSSNHPPLHPWLDRATCGIRKSWSQKSTRIICIVTACVLIVVAVFMALFLKFALPVLISNAFASSSGSSNSLTYSLFQINSLSETDSSTMDPDSSSIVRITGNMSLSVNATISNVNIPLNIPVSVAPMIWRVAVQTDVMTNESGIMTQETIYLPLATVSFLSPISIQDSVVSINEESINVQLLNSSDLGSSEVELPNASAFPLGAFYFRSFLNCLMSGSSADLPKLVIETNADINIGGWLSLKSIYLKRVLDIGQTLVDGGYTFASGTSASNNSASPLQVFLSNLTSNSGGSEYSASLTIKTPPKNALTLPPAGLEISARVNISSVPIARLELPKLQATQGTPNITTNVEATKLQSDWTIIGSLLQSSLKLGVDQVAAAYADGSSLPAWVLDLANAAWLSVPFDSLGSGVTGSVNSLVD